MKLHCIEDWKEAWLLIEAGAHAICFDCRLDGEKPDAVWSSVASRQAMGAMYFIILTIEILRIRFMNEEVVI